MVPAVVFRVHVPPFWQAGLQAEVFDALGAVDDVLEATTPEVTIRVCYTSTRISCIIRTPFSFLMTFGKCCSRVTLRNKRALLSLVLRRAHAVAGAAGGVGRAGSTILTCW